MKNKSSLFNIGLATILEIIVISTCVHYMALGQWKRVMLLCLSIVCILLPFFITWIANKKNLRLPLSFESVLLLFIFFALYFGETKNYYFKFGWYDTTLHAIAGFYAVIVGIYLVKGVIKKEDEVTNKRFIFFIVAFGFCFSIALGTIWEVFEYVGDRVLKVNMIKGGAKDTEIDIIANSVAAFITSVACYFIKRD